MGTGKRQQNQVVEACQRFEGQGSDGQIIELKLRNSLVLQWYKKGWKKFFDYKNLAWSLKNPTAIFRGLERQDHEGSFCYVALPDYHWVGEGREDCRPKRDGYVFEVYVDSSLWIYNWRWGKADFDDGNVPADYKERYGEKLWPCN